MVAMVLPLDVLTTLPLRRADVVTVWTAGPWLSRMSCRQLLESVTCYDVMPRKTCVVVIDSELPVRAAHICTLTHSHTRRRFFTAIIQASLMHGTRKATHGLDGQHQDVDRTLCGRVNQNDTGQG